ncbi:MAG: SAVED domain-containing protein [Pseudorhodoplanes sp.]|jgi:hypothetical protein|nr:SAVED domain-containing protein [Pseudorhodoplanes sp.]
MSQAVIARQQGDNFQARLFWLHAASLLDSASGVVRVAYEIGPKAFDDVLIEYDPARAPQDHTGARLLRDHLQCKWHVRPGEFGYTDLIDPAFSNAQTNSFLQRAHEAQVMHAPDGTGARFKLVTNWSLRRADPLMRALLTQTYALDLERLFDGTTDASAMGQLRKTWREHLGLDEDELRRVARTLGITQRVESAHELRDRLNDRLRAVGMVRVSPSEAGFFYDDLITKLHAQGRNDFDRQAFRDLCASERLFDKDHEREPVSIGVRSFMHAIDNLEARCGTLLSLVPHFAGRFIRDAAAWDATVFPELQAFVLKAARENDHLRVILDAHVSLAFGVGAILNVKSGKTVEIEQRTDGRRWWAADDLPFDPAWPAFEFEVEETGEGADTAVAVSLAHDVSPAVRTFVKAFPGIGRILHARMPASRRSVYSGHHAVLLAEALLTRLRTITRSGTPRPSTHLFIAGPNAFAFFLGQNQPAIGPVTVYEWDFEGSKDGTYRPGLRLPPERAVSV